MKTIATAFVAAKRAFGPALKTNLNPHLKNKYAGLGECLDAVDQALLANGIAVMQETFEDATGATVETVFLHESGESIRCGKLHVPAAKQDPQGFGSALTYARRYSLMTACGIAPEDDDGNAASKTNQPARPAQPPADNSPAARAARMTEGVKEGDTKAVAAFLAGLPGNEINAIWSLMDDATQGKLTAAWPVAA
jgi:hypothetical protein